MVQFSEVVKVERTSCTTCINLQYTLPCRIDKDIVSYMTGFGSPVYPLGSIRLLKIESTDGFRIEGKLEKNIIKFYMPKELDRADLQTIDRKIEFDKKLDEWMTKKLDISIVLGDE
jgi:hypothetical protein